MICSWCKKKMNEYIITYENGHWAFPKSLIHLCKKCTIKMNPSYWDEKYIRKEKMELGNDLEDVK